MLCLALLGALACRAVEEPQLAPSWTAEAVSGPLSHSDCVRLAATWAPTAAAWTARLAAARAAIDAAGRLANPILDVTVEDFGVDGPAGIPVTTTVGLMASLSDLFSRGARTAAARAQLEAQQADLRAEYAELSRAVRATYDELVVVRAGAELEAQLAAVARSQRDVAARFVELGERPPIERERAEAEWLQVEASAQAARNAAVAVEMEFCFALGLERPVPLQLSEALTLGDRQPGVEATLTEQLSEAAAARPELRSAESRYVAERERAQLAADRIRFLPSVVLGPRLEDGSVRGVAGLGVELPLFDRGGAEIRAQDAQLVAAAAALRASAHQVAREVSLANEQLRAGRDYLEHNAQDLAQRRLALRERTQRLYDAGEVGYEVVVQANRDELDARLALLDAERAVAAAQLDLDWALGRLSEPSLGGE